MKPQEKSQTWLKGTYLYDVADDDFSTPITIERFSNSLRDGRMPSCSLDKYKWLINENKVCIYRGL